MSKNLEVAYKSQWDSDAQGTRNDCGPASIAMILNFYGEKLTTDQVFKATGAGAGLITINQIQKAISSFGYTSTFEKNCSPSRIRELIDRDCPPMLLVHYGSLNSQQDKNFKGGHFMLAVGYREDGYFVNDPNFSGDQRKDGDHHNYTKNELEKSWADCVIDGNPINSLLWIDRKQPSASGDEKNALDLLKTFKDARPEFKNGNLEGAQRGLIDAFDKKAAVETENAILKAKQESASGAFALFLAALKPKK